MDVVAVETSACDLHFYCHRDRRAIAEVCDYDNNGNEESKWDSPVLL